MFLGSQNYCTSVRTNSEVTSNSSRSLSINSANTRVGEHVGYFDEDGKKLKEMNYINFKRNL